MKKIILATIIIVVVALSYFALKLKGTLPAILPPASITPPEDTKGQSVNESNLNLPQGFSLRIFAKDLEGPRDLEVSPQGTILASIPSQGKVVALPDINNDHKADR